MWRPWTDFNIKFKNIFLLFFLLSSSIFAQMPPFFFLKNQAPLGCGAGLYLNASVCTNVATGYYSPTNDNNRYACPGNRFTSGVAGVDADDQTDCLAGIDYYGATTSTAAFYVGIGFYSPYRDNNWYSCTNKIANSDYTSAGGGVNSCSYACTTDYYYSGGVCYYVGVGYYSPYADNNLYACSNKIANSTYTSSGGGSNSCAYDCAVDAYNSAGSCVYVGNGYYSPDANPNRYVCTNKPANSAYTSSGNGSNNCSFGCDAGYYYSGGTCAAVGVGYYSPALDNNRYACTNGGSNSTYSSTGGATNSCTWSCNSGYTLGGGSCQPNTRSTTTLAGSGYLATINCVYNNQPGLCDAYYSYSNLPVNAVVTARLMSSGASGRQLNGCWGATGLSGTNSSGSAAPGNSYCLDLFDGSVACDQNAARAATPISTMCFQVGF